MDRKGAYIRHIKSLLEEIPKDLTVKKVFGVDIKNLEDDKGFSFEKDVIHSIIIESDDSELWFFEILDPYEPFKDRSVIKKEKVSDLGSFKIHFTFSIETGLLKTED